MQAFQAILGGQAPRKDVVGAGLIGWGGRHYSYFKEESEAGFQRDQIWMKLKSFKSWLWSTWIWKEELVLGNHSAAWVKWREIRTEKEGGIRDES